MAETLSLDDRLLYPIIHGNRASWDDALDTIAVNFKRTIEQHGPDSVAFYVSGQMLTEDYYVANKLMKGFIGSANIDTNSRLCMASSVAGHKRAFGADTVPGCYEDLELANLVVLVGSNLAWCHPVLYQRLVVAKETRGTKVVVIDPRRTATCEIADLHLALAPGTDAAVFNGLLAHLDSSGARDDAFVADHTNGVDMAIAEAQRIRPHDVSNRTGLSREELCAFYDMFAGAERVVTIYSQGVNQSASGTDKVNAIINCHLLTGRIGRPGMGPFSVTGQPNAMGGREVGGLANQLAAHMALENDAHRDVVKRFWRAPRIANAPGLNAVDLFRAVGDGRIKALWIMATNPVDSLPEADAVRAALQGCPFVVVSDVTRHTDTTATAHVLLPSAAWGEKDGTVTNSERRISRQRPFLTPPGEAKPDWWQLTQVARCLGFAEAFSYEHPAEIFAEHALLSGYENDGTRGFDISAYADVSRSEYDMLAPFQWPQTAGIMRGETRFFANGGFFTPDRRARFVPTPIRAPVSSVSREYPLILNTGRIRDQWHTMTRTAKTARLMTHIAEPFLEIHPDDAAQFGLMAASLAHVESPYGTAVLRTLITDRQRPGSMFAPMHWTDQFASRARIDALVGAHVDPVSGQPESKYTPVAVRPFPASWYGFAVMGTRPQTSVADYWALAPAKRGWRLELAGLTPPDDWSGFARHLMGLDERNTELMAYHDPSTRQHRFAAFNGDRLLSALFVAPEPVAVSRTWITDQLCADADAEATARLRVLAGRAGENVRDRGAIVCSCFDVGINQIVEAVTKGGCLSVAEVGQALRAGTNCGTCRADIGSVIDEACLAKAG